jgi:hypothetical protein
LLYSLYAIPVASSSTVSRLAIISLAIAVPTSCGGDTAGSGTYPEPGPTDVSQLPQTSGDRLAQCLKEQGGLVTNDPDPLVPQGIASLRAQFGHATYRAQLAEDNEAAYRLWLDVKQAAPGAGVTDIDDSVEHLANVVFFPETGSSDGDARVAFAICLGGY